MFFLITEYQQLAIMESISSCALWVLMVYADNTNTDSKLSDSKALFYSLASTCLAITRR